MISPTGLMNLHGQGVKVGLSTLLNLAIHLGPRAMDKPSHGPMRGVPSWDERYMSCSMTWANVKKVY